MKKISAKNPRSLVTGTTAALTTLASEGHRPEQPEDRGTPLWLVGGFWASIVIAVAVVVRRLIALAHPSQTAPPQMLALDAVFASHAVLTLAHIVPAMAFVLLTPFFFLRRTGAMWADCLCTVHKWL